MTRVAILLKGSFGETPAELKRESQQVHTAQAVSRALENLGMEPMMLPLSPPDFSPLEKAQADLIFNLYASTGEEQALVSSLLELTRLPYTGSSPTGHFLALHKRWAKSIWRDWGLPTPASFEHSDPSPDDFPLIVKPDRGGSGEGVYTSCLVHDRKELDEQLAWMASFSPLLVERYVAGRELTVGLLGNPPRVLPPLEITFDRLPPELPPILSFEAKTRFVELVGVRRANLEPTLEKEVVRIAEQGFLALNLRDYARLDLRIDEQGQPTLLEANSLPGLQPDYSDFPRAAELASYSYPRLIGELVRLALERRP
jgi:D-alanine--D-alanine ligase